MTTLTVTKARNELAEATNKVAYTGERIVLQRHGRAMAAIVSMEDLELLQALENKLDLAAAKAALAEARGKGKGTVPWKKLKAQLGL